MAKVSQPDENGPLSLPQRPDPQPELATQQQYADGTLVRPPRIEPKEITQPNRWWRHDDKPATDEEIDDAVATLPDCLKRAVREILNRRRSRLEAATKPAFIVLLHDPEADIADLSGRISRAVFKSADFLIADCSLKETSGYRLFGTPPGYAGHLEGGVVANQLVRRPGSVVVFRNFEFADHLTLETLRGFALGERPTPLLARGGEAFETYAGDAVFVLATSRWVLQLKDSAERSDRGVHELLELLQKARPDLENGRYDLMFAFSQICICTLEGAVK